MYFCHVIQIFADLEGAIKASDFCCDYDQPLITQYEEKRNVKIAVERGNNRVADQPNGM